MPQLQKPNANFLKAKQLDSQAWNIYALLAIFTPFLLYFARLIGITIQITGAACMKVPDDVALFWAVKTFVHANEQRKRHFGRYE